MTLRFNPLAHLGFDYTETGGGGGGGGITWNASSGSSITAADNNGYICQNAGLTTISLPLTGAVGTIIEILAATTGGFIVSQSTGQQILFSGASSTAGVTGSLSSTQKNDAIRLICTTAGTVWTVIGSVGNFNLA